MARQFARQPPGEPAAQHPEIAEERPERIAEGGRAVALDEGVAEPGETVARHQRRQQEPPIPGHEGRGQQPQAQRGADEMERPVAGPAVLSEIERPEFAVGLVA